MTILISGGAGYIGSHTIVELIKQGHAVVVADSLINSSRESLRRVEELTDTSIPFYEIDLRDRDSVSGLFSEHAIDAVIHFAGLKAVGESTRKPLDYYDANLGSTFVLLDSMKNYTVKKLVFSSSATVYGSAPIPYSESYPAGRDISSPYGRSKFMIEQILQDYAAADPTLELTSLRYFNPIGAHSSGRIGEDPIGVPNNLMPFIAQVASGQRDQLTVFGNDYDTPDGTCIRDYIHVDDVASGHVGALTHSTPGYHVYNLGSGKGTSVLELVAAFEEATGKRIPYSIAGRRDGDLPAFYADATNARNELSWSTQKSITEACRDTWNWQSHNPRGYRQ